AEANWHHLRDATDLATSGGMMERIQRRARSDAPYQPAHSQCSNRVFAIVFMEMPSPPARSSLTSASPKDQSCACLLRSGLIAANLFVGIRRDIRIVNGQFFYFMARTERQGIKNREAIAEMPEWLKEKECPHKKKYMAGKRIMPKNLNGK